MGDFGPHAKTDKPCAKGEAASSITGDGLVDGLLLSSVARVKELTVPRTSKDSAVRRCNSETNNWRQVQEALGTSILRREVAVSRDFCKLSKVRRWDIELA